MSSLDLDFDLDRDLDREHPRYDEDDRHSLRPKIFPVELPDISESSAALQMKTPESGNSKIVRNWRNSIER
jgi:hypothetical protein